MTTHPGKFGLLYLDRVPWHRLRTIEFSGCTSINYLGRERLLRHEEQTGGSVPLIVVYNLFKTDLVEQGLEPSLWGTILEDMVQRDPVCDMFGPTSRLSEVVVRVSTEHDKAEAIRIQTEYFWGVPEPERTRRLALIKYEVNEATSVAGATAT